MVSISCESPSSAKNSPCSGTRTECAATIALTVSRLKRRRAVDQDIVEARSARLAGSRSASCSRKLRFSLETSSISAERDRSSPGRSDSPSMRVFDRTSSSGSPRAADRRWSAARIAARCQARSRHCPADRDRRAAPACPISASAAPRLIAVVVLPTPPFWLAMAMIRGRLGGDGVRHARYSSISAACRVRSVRLGASQARTCQCRAPRPLPAQRAPLEEERRAPWRKMPRRHRQKLGQAAPGRGPRRCRPPAAQPPRSARQAPRVPGPSSRGPRWHRKAAFR